MTGERRVPCLVIQSPFGGYDRGARVTDPAKMEEILAGPNASHVTRSTVEASALEEGDAGDAAA